MINKQLLITVPGLTGAIIGAVKGAVDGYTSSKKEHLVYNYYNTIGGVIVGSAGGLLLGSTWFMSIPIVLARSIEGIPTEGNAKLWE
jgi:hypothetical protein